MADQVDQLLIGRGVDLEERRGADLNGCSGRIGSDEDLHMLWRAPGVRGVEKDGFHGTHGVLPDPEGAGPISGLSLPQFPGFKGRGGGQWVRAESL